MQAPVALFVYNRPDHCRRTLEALAANEGAASTELHIFCDGPKRFATKADLAAISEVRELVVHQKGFKEVFVYLQDENRGLAASVIAGVTQLLNLSERIIVLEDDIVTSPAFLAYMNKALDFYADEEKVASVHAYTYPITGLPEFFFLRGADCWGWGTWRRAWKVFEKDGQVLLDRLISEGLLKDFDFGGYGGYSQMLRQQIEGKVNSWAIRWYASAYLQGMLTLYPGTSYITNIGVDGSGEHCDPSEIYGGMVLNTNPNPRLKDLKITEDQSVKALYGRWFKNNLRRETFITGSLRKLRKLFNGN